ncbi:hypothetical protein EZV62_017901 [Acer yangbiense]|uniref:Uncharacterized protein n=1 Tax=Acer yangbiense TaxID=1000413 RepID=A0A5C7HIB1_9ROSI|nr:hypothetical protein EZV62_017901 [Acer yangbiense]
MMVSSTLSSLFHTNFTVCQKPINLHKQKILTGSSKKPTTCSSSSLPFHRLIFKSIVPFAVSATVLLSSNPAKAGFLSGFSGIESVPGPDLPQIEFLERFNEDNQKKYAEFDARFKESPLLKKLLEKSKLNKEKNQQEIQDKYCLRGAEWGVGDCSAEGMLPQDRDDFIAMLKQKVDKNE